MFRRKCTALLVALAAVDSLTLATAAEPAAQSKWPAPYPYPIGAGIQGLASGSTAVVVADVLETNPEGAMEGARDNMKMKVVQVLMGRPVAGDTLNLYYHLLWIDDSKTLEPPKFEKGKRYIVFLHSHDLVDADRNTQMAYELSDQWLSVISRRDGQFHDQLKEIAAAIRKAHGDARGAWSEAVGPLQARLVAYHAAAVNGSPIISVYLDLKNVSGGDNTVQFDLSGATITWEVTDERGKTLASAAPPGNQPSIILDQKVVLESGAGVRLSMSQTGPEIPKDRGGYLCLAPGNAWSFGRGDKAKYFLSAKIDCPSHGQQKWQGTLVMPRLEIPLD